MIPTSVRPAQVICTRGSLRENPADQGGDTGATEQQHHHTGAAPLALLLGWRGRVGSLGLRLGSRPRGGTGGRGGRSGRSGLGRGPGGGRRRAGGGFGCRGGGGGRRGRR